nr:hypothetical protein Iba_chr08aCG12180 [Ipomoea batatas]
MTSLPQATSSSSSGVASSSTVSPPPAAPPHQMASASSSGFRLLSGASSSSGVASSMAPPSQITTTFLPSSMWYGYLCGSSSFKTIGQREWGLPSGSPQCGVVGSPHLLGIDLVKGQSAHNRFFRYVVSGGIPPILPLGNAKVKAGAHDRDYKDSLCYGNRARAPWEAGSPTSRSVLEGARHWAIGADHIYLDWHYPLFVYPRVVVIELTSLAT